MKSSLRKNTELTPKMPEYTPVILKKSYVDFYDSHYCNEFLESGKYFRITQCGYYEYYVDEKYRQLDLKDSAEWCEIELMAECTPPDCSDFFVKAEDLERVKIPNFKF